MSKILKYSVVILPIIFLWAGLNFGRNNYPNDPEYIYLLNSLCICDGQSVGHVDNPGTTLMQIGAGTIGIMHLFSNPHSEKVVEHVLQNPNKFIEGIRAVIVILNSIFLLALGWLVYKKTGSVWQSLLLQIGTFISAYILEVIWAKLSPEPLLFFVTGIYVVISLFFYLEKEKNNPRYILFFALITGAGLATKATFLPLIVLPLLVLPTIKRKAYYLLGIVPSFVLFTIPAATEYDRMFHWFSGLISHSGIYGHGTKEIINLQTYLPNIQSILINNPSIPIFLGIGTLTLSVGYFFRKQQNIYWKLKFLVGLLATYIFGILLVAKHYSGDHYLIPVLLLAGITMFTIIDIATHIINNKYANRIFFPIVVLSLVIFIALKHPKKLKQANRQYKIASEEIETTNNWVKENYSEYTIINYYIYSINKFTGLKFGNDFAKGKMLSHLKRVLPYTYFYELSSNLYLNWSTKTNLQDIIKTNGNKILLVNAPGNQSEIEKIEKQGFPLKQIYKGQSQNIYMLDTLRYIAAHNNEKININEVIRFNADSSTKDGRFFLGSNSEIFGPVNARTKDEAKSGQYSIKLDKLNPFAVDYNLRNTKQGELYQIDVWRKSKTSSGFLVVANSNDKIYYNAVENAIKTDTNGWKLLRINVEITAEMEGKNLKIYLWNPSKEPAFFDDMTITRFYETSK